MAKESEINRRRRKIAMELFSALVFRHGRNAADKAVQEVLALAACNAADVLMHEFDERRWQ